MSAPPMGVLHRCASVLDLLVEHGPLTPAELAERTGTPRASVYRLVDALSALGLTEPSAGGSVGLGLRWLRLGDSASAALTEWSHAQQILDDLAEHTGLTAFLSLPRPAAALCVRWSEGSGVGVLILRPGRSLPLYAGAAGRLCLAYADDPEDYLVSAPFERLTGATLTTAEELRADVAATRARGWSVSDEDVTEGIVALGAAVLDPAGRLVGALSVAGLAEPVRADQKELAGALLDATDRLARSDAT